MQLKFWEALLSLGSLGCFGIMYKSNNIFDISDDCLPKERIESCSGFSYDSSPGSDGKESAQNVGNLCSIPGLGRSPGEGHGNPL